MKLYPVFCEAPVILHRYKFKTNKRPNGLNVRAPSLQQARNWLSALEQKEVKLLSITKYINL